MTSGRTEATHSIALQSDAQARSRSGADTALSALAALGLGALVLATLVAFAVTIASAAGSTSTSAPASDRVDSFEVSTDTSLVFILQLGNRLFPDWKEERGVRLHEHFVIGDTEYTAVVTKLLPDFRIIDGKAGSLSPQMNNPAARVMVYHDSSVADSSWAFLNFPPHFSPRSFFTFQLKEVVGYAAGGASPALAGNPKPNNTVATQAAKAASAQGDKASSKKD
jgi:hypothetical protein